MPNRDLPVSLCYLFSGRGPLKGEKLNELALFAGAGGGILGGKLLGWRTVCAVEINAFCARRLMQRQNEGHLPPFPVWDDVCTFDGLQWKGRVDVVSGGFPCQDISCAGKGAGINGKKSGLWFEMARIISEVRPKYVVLENSPQLTNKGLGIILGQLTKMGFDARWGVVGANNTGFPQIRKRLYLLAYSMPRDRSLARLFSRGWWESKQIEKHLVGSPESEPPMVGVVDGMENRMDRLRAIGNGQVPAVVRLAWEILGPS